MDQPYLFCIELNGYMVGIIKPDAVLVEIDEAQLKLFGDPFG